MEKIIIQNETGMCADTKVFDADGNDLMCGLVSIDLKLRPDEPVTAELKYSSCLCSVEAIPLLSLDNLRYFAGQHGYYLQEKKCIGNHHDFSISPAFCSGCGMSLGTLLEEEKRNSDANPKN
jgi:hypothetical protein